MIKTFVKPDNHVINHVIQSKRVQEDGVASYLGLSSVLTILLDMALRYRTSQILNYLSFQKKKKKASQPENKGIKHLRENVPSS